MPELPEVETVRRDVDAVLVGRRIDEVVLGRLRSVRRVADPEDFRRALRGARVVGTGRHGKYLLVNLGSGSVLVVHLRMSGQLLHGPADLPLRPHTHVRLQLDDGSELRFVDPRTFGEMFVTTSSLPELSGLGPDALDPALSGASLRKAAVGRRAALKAFLLDQRVLAGVGSIYADEICFRAGLRPGRSVARVSGPQFGRLHGHVRDVLAESIEARGSTLGDRRGPRTDRRRGSNHGLRSTPRARLAHDHGAGRTAAR